MDTKDLDGIPEEIIEIIKRMYDQEMEAHDL